MTTTEATVENQEKTIYNRGFSQKAVQPSYGRPFLEETQGKFT